MNAVISVLARMGAALLLVSFLVSPIGIRATTMVGRATAQYLFSQFAPPHMHSFPTAPSTGATPHKETR